MDSLLFQIHSTDSAEPAADPGHAGSGGVRDADLLRLRLLPLRRGRPGQLRPPGEELRQPLRPPDHGQLPRRHDEELQHLAVLGNLLRLVSLHQVLNIHKTLSNFKSIKGLSKNKFAKLSDISLDISRFSRLDEYGLVSLTGSN